MAEEAKITTEVDKVNNNDHLSTKITNIPVVNNSLETVVKTCKELRDSNTYVEYGITVAEKSFDKAYKAGKSVLDSTTLAPIKNRAIDNSKCATCSAVILPLIVYNSIVWYLTIVLLLLISLTFDSKISQ